MNAMNTILLVLSIPVGSALLVTGCAEKPADLARATFERARAALRSGDYGALYDMMSKEARARADADVRKKAEAAAAVKASLGRIASSLLDFDPAEVAALPPREAYIKVMGGVHKASSDLDSAARSRSPTRVPKPRGFAAATVVKCEADGDRATVVLSLPGELASGAKVEVGLVREGEDGEWLLAEPFPPAPAASSVRPRKGPDVPLHVPLTEE